MLSHQALWWCRRGWIPSETPQSSAKHNIFYFYRSCSDDIFFCRPTRKLASPWFPRQKPNRICALAFGLLQKISSLFQDNGTRSAKMLTLKFWPTKIWHPCSNLYTVIKEKKKKLSELESLRQPASADFLVFSTYFLGDFWVFSTFCCINLKQHVEKTLLKPVALSV